MEDEVEIIRALQHGVIAAIAQSDDPDLPVKYLLMDVDIPQDQKWLELVWIPNNRQGDFLGDEKNHRGILRLILHWPNQATGVYAPVALLASITRYFVKGSVLSSVQIYAKPDIGSLIEDGDDTLFPASIYYNSYRKGA